MGTSAHYSSVRLASACLRVAIGLCALREQYTGACHR